MKNECHEAKFYSYKNPDIHPSLIQKNHNENHNENQKIRDISVKAKRECVLESPHNTSLFAQEAHDPSERVNAVYALETFSNVFLGELTLLSEKLFDEIFELFVFRASRRRTHATVHLITRTIVINHFSFLTTSTLKIKLDKTCFLQVLPRDIFIE